MINKEIIDYIKKELTKGNLKEKIINDLVSGGGWTRADLEEAFSSVGSSVTEVQSIPKKQDSLLIKFFYFIEFLVVIGIILAVLFILLIRIPFAGIFLIVLINALITLISAIWIYIDAKKLKKKGASIDKPILWALLSFFTYILGLSIYLAFRRAEFVPQVRGLTETPKKKTVNLFTIFLIMILIVVGWFGFSFLKGLKTGEDCLHNNSKFDFKFEYNCQSLTEVATIDCGDKTCSDFEYTDGSWMGYSVRKFDRPLSDYWSNLGGSWLNEEHPDPSDSSIMKTVLVLNEYQLTDDSEIIEKKTTHEGELLSEKKLVSFLSNDSGVSFYQLAYESPRFCVINLKPRNLILICFENSRGFDSELEYILRSFSFY